VRTVKMARAYVEAGYFAVDCERIALALGINRETAAKHLESAGWVRVTNWNFIQGGAA
jgi:hypothetical protein